MATDRDAFLRIMRMVLEGNLRAYGTLKEAVTQLHTIDEPDAQLIIQVMKRLQEFTEDALSISPDGKQ